MSETPETTSGSTAVSHEAADSTKPAKLRRALTWVGIVAGAVFVVAAIFVAGAATSWFSGQHDQPRHEAGCMAGMKDMPNAPMPGDKAPMADGKDCCGPKKT